MTAAVIQGSYTNFKTVPTRNVLQIIVEVPIEDTLDVINILGAPVPGIEVPVAIALLQLQEDKPMPEPSSEGKKLVQRAAILCDEVPFMEYLGASNSTHCAEVLRANLGISSRAEIASNIAVQDRFKSMIANYLIYLNNLPQE